MGEVISNIAWMGIAATFFVPFVIAALWLDGRIAWRAELPADEWTREGDGK